MNSIASTTRSYHAPHRSFAAAAGRTLLTALPFAVILVLQTLVFAERRRALAFTVAIALPVVFVALLNLVVWLVTRRSVARVEQMKRELYARLDAYDKAQASRHATPSGATEDDVRSDR